MVSELSRSLESRAFRRLLALRTITACRLMLMVEEPRYREDEVKEILRLAAHTDVAPASVAGDDGLTLRQVQEIAREVGLDPASVAEAALRLQARGERLPRQQLLGMPVSVGRIVALPRPITDREWETVVSDLRDTFSAPGEVGVQGGAREWSNGNLRVLLESTEFGDRLRFSTLNRRLRFVGGVGAALLVTGLVFLAMRIPEMAVDGFTIRELVRLIPSLLVTGGGAAYLGWARRGLSRWAATRESQMEEVGSRVRALLAKSSGVPDV